MQNRFMTIKTNRREGAKDFNTSAWFGVVVTVLIKSTKLSYVKPVSYWHWWPLGGLASPYSSRSLGPLSLVIPPSVQWILAMVSATTGE